MGNGIKTFILGVIFLLSLAQEASAAVRLKSLRAPAEAVSADDENFTGSDNYQDQNSLIGFTEAEEEKINPALVRNRKQLQLRRVAPPLPTQTVSHPPTPPPQQVQQRPAPTPMATLTLQPQPQPQAQPHSSEVVSAGVTPQAATQQTPFRQTPQVATQQIPVRQTPQVQRPEPVSISQIIDCPRCNFNQCNESPSAFLNGHPWGGLSLNNRIDKTVKNVQFINRLHNMNMDVRVMVCIARKESTFNPTAKSCNSDSSASGMFQVQRSTADDVYRKNRSRVPGFIGLSGPQIHTKMAQSSLAQTEASMLTVLTKASLVGRRDMLEKGTGNTQEYSTVLRAYYGLFQPGQEHYASSIRYQDRFAQCYRCLKLRMDNDGKYNESLDSCFNFTR